MPIDAADVERAKTHGAHFLRQCAEIFHEHGLACYASGSPECGAESMADAREALYLLAILRNLEVERMEEVDDTRRMDY